MSTPPGKLNLSGVLEPPEPRAAAPRPKVMRPTASAGLNLAGVLEPPRARPPAPRVSLPSVDSRLDSFVSEVIGEASRRTGYTYKLGEGSRTPEQQAEKVARGVSWTYNSAHMHGRGRDVLAYDAAGNYLKDGSHPAYIALGEVYGELAPKAPARVKWGVVRGGRQVDPGHFELEDGDGGGPPAPLRLDGVLEPLDLSGVLEPLDSDPLAGQDVQEGEEVVREVTPPPRPAVSLPPRSLPSDPATRRGRRDAAVRAEAGGGGLYRIPVGKGAAVEAAERVASYLAKEVDAPVEYVRGWLGTTALKDPRTKEVLQSSPTGHVTVSAEMVGQLRRDYSASLNLPTRAVRNVSEVLATHAPGEMAVESAGVLAAPVGAVVSKGAEGLRRVMKPADMFSARLMTRLSGGSAEQARAASDAVWNDKPLPAYAENFVAADIERDMSKLNPRIGKAYGVLARFLTDPTNLIPTAGVVKLADKFAEGVRVFRAARRAEEVAQAVADVERVVEEATDVARAGVRVEGGGGKAALEELGYKVERSAAPNRAAGEAAGGEVWKITDADGRVNIMRDDAELDDFARYVAEHSGASRGGASPVASASPSGGESLNLEGVLEPPHHSHAQPRTPGGQFDGPPEPPGGVDNLSGATESAPAPRRSASEVAADIRTGHARERSEFFAEQARRAKSPVQRQEFEDLAREYADEAAEARVSDVAQRVKGGAQVAPEEMADLERAVIAEDGAPTYIEVSAAPAPAPAGAGAVRPPRAARSPLRRAWDAGLDAFDATKSLFASGDVSAAGRQAFVPFLFDTRATVKGLREGLPSVTSRGHTDFARWLDSQPDAKVWRDMGLDLDSMTGSGTRNEFFTSRLAENIPVYGRAVIRPSDRIMTAQLDAVRLQNARSWAKDLRAAGMTPEANPEEYQAVARLINAASGRAELGRVGQAIYPVTRRVIFSPKLLKSRFTVVNPATYVRLPPAARRIAAWKLGGAAAKMAGILGLAYLTADEVGLNPFKSDFGLARFGDTTYDLTGGTGGKLRTIFKLVHSAGSTANAYRKGEEVEYKDTPWGVGLHFLRSQLAPTYSLIPDAVTGETYDREPFAWDEAVISRIVPGFAQDVYEGFTEGGGVVGGLKALPSFIGVSSRTRDTEEMRREWASAREASKIAQAKKRTADVLKDAPAEVRDELQRLRMYLPESDAEISGEIVAAVEDAKSRPGWQRMNDTQRRTRLEHIFEAVRKREGEPDRVRARRAASAKESERLPLTGRVAEEVKRLGVIVDPVFAGHKVGTMAGESAGFTGESLGQTPEMLDEYRRRLAADVQSEMARVMAFRGYDSKPEHVQRAAMQAAHDRVKRRDRGPLHYQTRRRDYGERLRLEDYQRELERRAPRVMLPGETLKLGGEGQTVNRLMRTEGLRESTNVEDVRDNDIGREIDRAGRTPLPEEERQEIAETLQRLDPRQFESFTRALDESRQMGVVGEGTAYAAEHAARFLGDGLGMSNASESAELLRMARRLARERRLRPLQFVADAAGGEYGAKLMDWLIARGEFVPDPPPKTPPVHYAPPRR